MKVYDVVFNNGIDRGNFSVLASNTTEATSKVQDFLSKLSARELKYLAGEGWKFFSVEERLVVNGIIIH